MGSPYPGLAPPNVDIPRLRCYHEKGYKKKKKKRFPVKLLKMIKIVIDTSFDYANDRSRHSEYDTCRKKKIIIKSIPNSVQRRYYKYASRTINDFFFFFTLTVSMVS